MIDGNDVIFNSMTDNKDDEHDDDEVVQVTGATRFSFSDNAKFNLRLSCLSVSNEFVVTEAP